MLFPPLFTMYAPACKLQEKDIAFSFIHYSLRPKLKLFFLS